MVIADPNIFDFYNLTFVRGDAATALARPTDIVMTQRAADRYFGNEDPIGQTLNLMDQVDVTVTAIIEDLPDNTHMAFEIVGSMAAIAVITITPTCDYRKDTTRMIWNRDSKIF